MKTKEKENGSETRTRSYAIAGIVAIAFALIAAMMVMPAAAFEPGECDIYVYSGQSIDAAVDSATDGQTVCVYNGTYSGVVSVNTPNITLKGEGADVVTYQDDTYIIFSDTGDASGCIIEGFKIVNNKGIHVMAPAPNCIIRNCAFELTNPENGILIAAVNTTFMNNVVSNSLPAYGTVQPWAASCILVNNTFIDNSGAAMYLYLTPNTIIARNNFSNNSDIMVYDPGENIKWYLNNFIDTSIGNTWSGPVPAVTYWNSTEQITYTYNPTYTNYLGNYWGSDYTGTDADGDGIGDTSYVVPDSLGEDYRPLMEPFENYPEAAGPTPSNDVYLEPATSSASFCQETTVQVYANTSDEFQGGQFNLTYDANCANVTDVEFNTAVWDNNTWYSAEDGSEWITFRRDLPVVSGTQLIANLTIHCCNESESLCETELHFMSDAEATAAGHNRYSALFNDSGVELATEWADGTFECVAAPEKPDLNVTEKYEEWVSMVDKTYNVTYTVKNVGAAEAGASKMCIYIDGVNVLNDSVGVLAAGANYANTVGPFTMSGNRDTIKVCADNDNVIDESDETNNCMENELAQKKVNVTIGCAVTAPGGMVSVPITMLDIPDYGAGTINVEYDSSVVTCEGVSGSTQSTVMSYNIDNTAGIVNISAQNTGGVTGDVIFATVTFKAVGSDGECSSLTLIVDYLGDIGFDPLPFYTTNCSICIADDMPPVTEYPSASPPRILNDNGRARVPGTNVSQLSVIVSDPSGVNSVTVNLTPILGLGFENVPMTLDSGTVYSGVWSATTNAATGVNLTHSLVANATDDFGNSDTALIPLTVLRRGDVVRNNRVDMGDALYIARYTVGLEPAPDEFAAGVVPASSWDGVNMGDALYIARYTVGLENAP